MWQAEDGLPQNSVNAIVQDTRGYIWLGTQEGLVRFDGIRFEIFDKKRLPVMSSNYIWTIAEGPDSSLWFGTQGGGLYRLKGNECRAFTTRDGLPSNTITALLMDATGRLWAGTNRGLALYDGRQFHLPMQIGTRSTYDISSIMIDRNGVVWVGTNGNGLFRIGPDRIDQFTTQTGLPDNTVLSLLELKNGSVLVSTNGGIHLVRDGRALPYRPASRSVSTTALSMLQDSLGVIWVGTAGGGLFRIRNDRQDFFGEEQGLSDGFIRSLCQDREGNLWIGTFGGGLNVLTGGQFMQLTRAEGLSHDFTLSVCEDDEEKIWIGTYGGGLNSIKRGRSTSFSTRDGLPTDIISAVLPDRSGAVWAGTYGGGLSRVFERQVNTFTVRDGLSNNFILSLFQDSRGVLWVGTTNGLNVQSANRFQRVKLSDDAIQPAILCILESSDGGMWVGTEGLGLALYKGGTTRLFGVRDGLPAEHITSLYEDLQNVLWIGTDGGGLVRYAEGRFTVIDSRVGLFDDVVFSILEDQFGGLWFSCNKGIFRITKEELNGFAKGTATRVQSVAYGKHDGMPSSECVGRRQPAAWKARNGFLWFPTIKGVVSIDPSHTLRQQHAPPVVVEEVIAGVDPVPLSSSITFQPGIDRLEIRYTAFSFTAPGRVQFRYKLEGVEENWVEAGTRRTAFYTNIPPGSYTFRVTAGNNEGVWNETGASVVLTIEPFFYQTWYFYGASLLVLVLVGYAGYNSRMYRHRRREQELVRIVSDRTKDLNQEILERKRMEEALRLSEQRFRDIVEHSTNLFYIHDTNHVLSYISPQSREFFDCEPEEALTRWTEFLTDNPINAIGVERTQRAIDTGLRQPKYELELITQKGRKILVEVHEAPIVRNGVTIAIVGALTDITGKKQLEEQLREASKLQSIGTLAGGIAHNFNNILGIILAYASMLRRERENRARFQDGIDAIHKTVERGAALVRQLLTFARKTDVMLETVDVNMTLQELASMISETFPKTVSFALQLEEHLPTVRMDPNQLHQALLNLCVNARDAMFGEGTLTLRTRMVKPESIRNRFPRAADVPYLAIDVADTGTGIADSIKNKIFEPFFTTKEVGKGTGLGLSVVYGIIEGRGGFIDIVTAVGKGTTFTIFLPADPGRETENREPEHTAAVLGGSETILVVEDELMLIELLKSMLERKGYHVLTAGDGAAAVMVFRQHHRSIQLVLMDIGLPGMSGWEALRLMKEINPGIPVILVSGYLEPEAQEQSLKEGAQAYIAKPYVPETVHAIIRDALDGNLAQRHP